MWWSEARSQAAKAALIVGLAVASAALSGCGFKPVYGTAASDVSDRLLADIAVNAPRDDIGALMEREVLAGFSTLGTQPADPRYLLQLNPRWLDQEVAIEQDTEVTRRNITVQTSFELYEVASNERIFSGEAVSQASYNRVTSEYANIIAARNATSRTVEAVAQDIRLKVAAFLAQRNAG